MGLNGTIKNPVVVSRWSHQETMRINGLNATDTALEFQYNLDICCAWKMEVLTGALGYAVGTLYGKNMTYLLRIKSFPS